MANLFGSHLNKEIGFLTYPLGCIDVFEMRFHFFRDKLECSNNRAQDKPDNNTKSKQESMQLSR